MRSTDIRVSDVDTACEVCGRTLLRGERAEIYLDGPMRRPVCELCWPRAVQEGWVREGTVPPHDGGGASPERRRGLLTRFRERRETALPVPGSHAADERRRAPSRERSASEEAVVREPRHVRAIPTSPEHKVVSAIDAFNASEHPRTVAGVARSLGLPAVSIHPSQTRPSVVEVVVSWELCWYRYEVDLADEMQSARVCAQGSELDELAPEERQPNAIADEYGLLALGT